MRGQFLWRARRAQHDQRRDAFVAESRRHTEDGGLSHGRMFFEEFLDLARIDLEAPFVDERRDPAMQGKHAVTIEPSQVAGHERSVDDDLAELAAVDRLAIVADDADSDAGNRAPH